MLLLLLLWALFIRRAGEEPSAYAASSFNDDASLREEVASFDGDALEVAKEADAKIANLAAYYRMIKPVPLVKSV